MRPVRRARPTPVLLLFSFVLVVVLAPAVPAGAGSTRSVRSGPGALAWKGCGSGFQCATLTVPLDASAPEPTVGLAVIRARARDADARIGTLVVNPGGPGVPAVEYLRGVASTLPDAVRDRFDLVAFDPRGVGQSEPIECLDSLDPVFDEEFEPATDAARTDLVHEMMSLAQQCATRNGDLLAHVSTVDAARDLDQLRIALGEERLSFL